MRGLRRRLRAPRFLVVPCLVLGLMVAGYAYTAANIVPASKAGDGTGAVTGYTISNIDYTLNGADPQLIDQVLFDVDVAPTAGSDIEVSLDDGSGVWYTCTFLVLAVTCDTTVGTQAIVLLTDELQVIIVD